MIKCIIITTANRLLIRELDEPLDYTIGEIVGGPIEEIRCPRLLSCVMLVNRYGTRDCWCINRAGSGLHGTKIAGDIVIVREGMQSIPDETIYTLAQRLADEFSLRVTHTKGVSK